MKLKQKDYTNTRQFLWTDLPGALRTAESGSRSTLFRRRRWKSDAQLLRHFIEKGYAIEERAVVSDDIDRFRLELDAALTNPESQIQMTYWDNEGHHHYDFARKEKLSFREAKVLDVHVRLPSSQRLIFAPKLMDFLSDIFQDEPMAFQTLYFENGSEQGAHQDTAFVYTDPPYHFAASWIALEDVSQGIGELFYYPRSHRLDDLTFADGTKALRPGDPDSSSYSVMLENIAEAAGLHREQFLPKRSDVLFWASDLIHGGERINACHTRRSLVTHYCPRKAVVPYARDKRRQPTRLDCGGWVIADY